MAPVQDKLAISPRVAQAPLVAKPAAKPAKRPSRLVDVAQFRIMPLSGAPQVSATVDETLGKTGVLPWILDKMEAVGNIGMKAANGLRVMTRVVGPAAFGFSAFWNARKLQAAFKDKNLATGSKVTLAVGTLGTAVGAFTAFLAAVPAKVAGFLRMGEAHQVLANKASGIAGGIAGIGFAAINLVETLRNPDASPAERFFAKAGFVVGAVGFVAGTAALLISMGGTFPVFAALATKLPSLLPIASKVATVSGMVGVGTWIGQLVLGKKAWLNQSLKGTVLG